MTPKCADGLFPFQVLTPRWPAAVQVKAQFTLRQGAEPANVNDGMSQFNLGTHVGDDAVRVADRRASVDEAFGSRAVYLNQVHGTAVQALAASSADKAIADADASWTRERGVACAIMVADCLPVLLCNRAGDRVGAAHAGWRGLAGQGGRGVLEALVQAYVAQGGQAGELMAWLGPCIGPTAFEVGIEVRDAFLRGQGGAAAAQAGQAAQVESAHESAANESVAQAGAGVGKGAAQSGPSGAHAAYIASQFVPAASPGKFMANLSGLARLRLQALGVADVHGNDGSATWCTVSDPMRFFSYRRDQARLGASGRMCAYIWLD